jgi:RHS repeat-associated protein
MLMLAGLLSTLLQAGYSFAAPVVVAAPTASHTPNTLARFQSTGNAWETKPQPFAFAPIQGPRSSSGKSADVAPASVGKPESHPITVALDDRALAGTTAPATGALTFASSEGLVHLDVPPHGIDVRHATVTIPTTGSTPARTAAPVGPFTLTLTQTQGGFRGTVMQLAQFDVHVRDHQGRVVQGVQLATPLTLRITVVPQELAGLNTAGLRLSWPETANQAKGIAAQSVPVTADAAGHLLTAQVSSLPSGPAVLSGSSSDANTASSEHLVLDANHGDVTFTVPTTLPPAAGGFLPPLQLVYSSAGPNGRNAWSAPAPAIGDGMNLSVGSISYDASNNVYYLNGVGGNSDVLLCCMADSHGHSYYVPHHHPEVRVRVRDDSTTPPNTSGDCFYVYTPDGILYELGCTPDSLRSTVTNGVKTYLEWDLDRAIVTNSSGIGYRQAYTATYWQDLASSSGITYTRDAGLKEVDYNYDASGNAQARVYFNIHWPGATTTSGPASATTYGTNYHCDGGVPPQPTTLRCDDPLSLTGWDPAPLNMSTLMVDGMVEQVLSGGAWHTARTYAFSYYDIPSGGCWNPQTGVRYGCAGEHTLRTVQETPYQVVGGVDTAMPSRQPMNFGYTYLVQNSYLDYTQLINGNPYNLQTWWQYLNSFSDAQTGAGFTATVVSGYGNTHGVNSTWNTLDPTTCNNSGACTGAAAQYQDRQWPRQIVTAITDTGTNTTTQYYYQLNQACGSLCTQDTWIPPQYYNGCGDVPQPPNNPTPSCLVGTWQNYYNEEFTGFQQVTARKPDGSQTITQYYAGNGWGTNDWDVANTYRGWPMVSDVYQGGYTGALLQEVQHTYWPGACPSTQANGWQLGQGPYLMCDQLETRRDTYLGGNSSSSPAAPHLIETWNYQANPQGNFGTAGQNDFYNQLTSSTVSGSDLRTDSFTPYTSQPTFTTNYSYVWRDGTQESPQLNYYNINTVAQQTLTDTPGTTWSCTRTSYDGAGFATGQNTSLWDSLPVRRDAYTDAACGNSSSAVTTGTGYDSFGQPLVTTDADAVAGVTGHTGCTASAPLRQVYPTGASSYTSCATYDGTQHVYQTATTNALNQQTMTAYDVIQGIPTSETDVNGAVTINGGPVFEYSGTPSLATFQDVYAQTTLPTVPSDTTPWTSRVFSFSFCAGATTGGKPCLETDTVRQLDNTNLTVSRAFFDRDGRLVETRTSGPSVGSDTVSITSYDDANTKTWTSQPCVVGSLTASNGGRTVSSTNGYFAPTQTSSGSSAYVDPAVSGTTCSSGTLTGTTTYLDAEGRAIATDDAIGTGVGTSGSGCILPGGTTHHTTCTLFMATCAGTPCANGETYLAAITVDANLHQTATYTDALGRVAYQLRTTGANQQPAGTGINPYALTSYTYDANGNRRTITDAGGHTLSFTYDALGRQTGMSDPDRGSETYTYDPNGNQTQTVDARGASGTVYLGYDGLNRALYRNTTIGPTGAYVTNSYDSTAGGNQGKGRRTGQTFSGTLGSGTHSYVFDARGELTSTTLTVGAASYPSSTTYNDAGNPLVETYPNGETLTSSYNATGAFAQLTRTTPATGATTLAGLTTVGGTQDSADAGIADAYEYTASASGSANLAYVYVDQANQASQIQVGLYSNTTVAGTDHPGTLLTSATISSPTANAWNSVTLPAASVTAGQSYWIAVLAPSGSGTLYDQLQSGPNTTESSSSNSLSSLPSAWSSGPTWGQLSLSAYVVQAGTSGTTTTLVDTVQYNSTNGMLAGERIGTVATLNETYDGLLRSSDSKTTKISSGATLFEEAPSYDAVNNVSGVTLTLPGGTAVEKYCYDALDRLTWASSASGTIPCGGTNTAGTLAGASYTQSFAYDTLDRLTSGPLGSYTYGDSAHLHGATAIGTQWTGSYDASGNLTCRAPSSASTCAGTQTGAQLGYDNEGQLTAWQNAPTSPTSTDRFLYDGDGQRIQQQSTSGGATTTTTYVDDLEEVATTGSTTTTTTYYSGDGQRVALAVNGTLSYLAADHLGSVSASLDSTGTLTAAQLYLPYGGVLYATGTMPTSKGFSGQRADGTTGLDYFQARYYDPVAGLFSSADSWLTGGLNRYAYVGDNPLTRSDPTGHDWWNAIVHTVANVAAKVAPIASTVLDATTGIPSMIADVKTILDPNVSLAQKLMAGGDLALNVVMDVTTVVGVGEGLRAAYMGAKIAAHVAEHVAEEAGAHVIEHATEDAVAHEVEHAGEGEIERAATACPAYLSFAADTLVMTPHGAQAIGTLKVGDQVTAYDPITGKPSAQTVQHVWINHDHDLLDVTLRVDAPPSQDASLDKAQRVAVKAHGSQAPPTDEIIHTTANHPWLTTDRGWVLAGELRLGEHVVRLDGTTATVTALVGRPGVADYYNLTVSELHTYAVGVGQYVVHNCGGTVHSRYADGTPVYEGQQPPKLPANHRPEPGPGAEGPHSRLRWDSVNQRVYQAREFDADGYPVRDIDFTTEAGSNGQMRGDKLRPPTQHPWSWNTPGKPRAGFKRLGEIPFTY